jgi:mannose-1-phosphate guanylyltransferase
MARNARQAGRWALLLAAGDGTRLRQLTEAHGVSAPKQYCAVGGERTLLELACDRARRVVPATNVLAVVAEGHRRFWRRDLAGLARESIVVQPANRGTGVGILLPLLELAARAPGATVALLPCDHHVLGERTLAGALRAAFAAAERPGGRIVLLGLTPETAAGDLGWIVPGDAIAPGEVAAVEAFVEKPGESGARELAARGGLWNGFLVVARAAALLALFRERTPRLVERLERARVAGPQAVADCYSEIEPLDFSRGLLEGAEARLAVLPVPPCGWSDLGTPERVVARLRRLARDRRLRPPAEGAPALTLAVAAAGRGIDAVERVLA